MALVFITGISGAGKSTVRDALKSRGYEAHDTDEDGITSWRHKETNEPTHRPTKLEDRTNDFYAQHDWKMSRERIELLAEQAKDKPVFLCGATSNNNEMRDLFDKVVCLTLDEATLKERLANRTTNDFGKSPDELANILSWHKSSEDEYRSSGAVMIDATRPIHAVVEDILASTVVEKK
jgi:dephospho-CoA kinase